MLNSALPSSRRKLTLFSNALVTRQVASMGPKRSTRARDPLKQKPFDAIQYVPDQAEKAVKRKASTEQNATGNVAASKKAKKIATTAVEQATTSKIEQSDLKNLDKMLSLSPEILNMIAMNITSPQTVSAFSRTSRGFYALMAPRLYGRVVAAAFFHAHIAKLIRTLEPHLTIAQKKQLKKEGKYKGQQERYPTGLDEKKIPVCAGFVRQLIIGHSDPGKKHKYIVERYLEEALKNMENLEIVETYVVTRSICESIASLTHLKALYVHPENMEPDEILPLASVKNLKHLCFQIGYGHTATYQSLLRNSMSTLQSLEVVEHSGLGEDGHVFRNWEANLKSSGHDTASRAGDRRDFPALRSLLIEGMNIDEEFVTEFHRAIDFSKLHKVTFRHLRDSRALLWPSLTSIATLHSESKTPLDLRILSVDMEDSSSRYWDLEQHNVEFAAKCAFIASFDTLTTLELPDYGHYKTSEGLPNPGLSDALLQAILKHHNLRVLKISYQSRRSGIEIPYLGADAIRAIVDGLPHLREFEFAPDESRIEEVTQALCRSKSLESVRCFPIAEWTIQSGTEVSIRMLSAFMANAELDNDSKKFVWEDHYKLNRLTVYPTDWNVASKFPTGEKGRVRPHEKAGKVQIQADAGTREVAYQPIVSPIYVNIGYDPTFQWVDKVEKEMK